MLYFKHLFILLRKYYRKLTIFKPKIKKKLFIEIILFTRVSFKGALSHELHRRITLHNARSYNKY